MQIMFHPPDPMTISDLTNAIQQFDVLYAEYVECHEVLCAELTDEQFLHEDQLFKRHEKHAIEFRQSCNAWLHDALSNSSGVSFSSTDEKKPAASQDQDAATPQVHAAPLDKGAAKFPVHQDRPLAPSSAGAKPAAALARSHEPESAFADALQTQRSAAPPATLAAPAAPSATYTANAAQALASDHSTSPQQPWPPSTPALQSQLSAGAMPFAPAVARHAAAVPDRDDPFPTQVPQKLTQSTFSNTPHFFYDSYGRPFTPMTISRMQIPPCGPNDATLDVSMIDDECMSSLNAPVNPSALTRTGPLHEQNSLDPLLTALSLPKPDLNPFSGNVSEYQMFISSFDSRIGNRLSCPIDKLYYLNQFLRDDARDLISGCFHLQNEGYEEARRLLDREYGDPFKASTEFVNEISKFAPIKSDDPRALRKFATLLNKCLQAMRHVSHLNVLDHPTTMLAAVRKLPMYLQNKWCEHAFDISRYATPKFAQLVQFVMRASDVANDPVYGQLPASTESKHCDALPMKFTSLAVSVNSEKSISMCDCCGGKDHDDLGQCPTFRSKSVEAKRSELKALDRCFGCLGRGHYANRCSNRLECEKCFKKHPTCLHVDGFVMPPRITMKRECSCRK